MTPSYALGLFFIFLVSIIWSAASIVVQHLYRVLDFDSPFLLTYVSTSLFVILIPSRLLWERRKRFIRCVNFIFGCSKPKDHHSYSVVHVEDDGNDDDGSMEEERIIPWRKILDTIGVEEVVPVGRENAVAGQGITTGSLELTSTDDVLDGETSTYQNADPKDDGQADSARNFTTCGDEDKSSISGKSSFSCFGGSIDSDVDNVAVDNSLVGLDVQSVSLLEQHCINKASEKTTEISPSAASAQTEASVPIRDKSAFLLSHIDHISMALRIGPVWFLSNYFYNMSLAYTSISSSTVLASTGSLFTFLFAVSCGDEKMTAPKIAGVALCFAGSALTGFGDAKTAMDENGSMLGNATQPLRQTLSLDEIVTEGDALFLSEPNDKNDVGLQLWGDLAGFVSAIGYGTYTVLIRNICPKDESVMSMQLLLGYIGAINGFFLLPIAVKIMFFSPCPLSGGASPTGIHNKSDHDLDSPSGDDSYRGNSSCEEITIVVLAYLLSKAFFDNVLSDYLWARAVVLTSATVATVGLGLTIPLAFLSDWFMGHNDAISLQSVAGAVAVLFGFVFVNFGEGGNEYEYSSHDGSG